MIARVTGEIATAFGGLDIIVNNAGFAMQAMIDGDDYPVSWDKSLAVMLKGPQVLIRESLAHLRQSERRASSISRQPRGLAAAPAIHPIPPPSMALSA